MPTRLHKPLREGPPRITDRILAHPWELTIVSGAWAIFGGLLCWAWIDPGGGPSTILHQLDDWAAGAVAVALLASGLLVLAAVLWPGKDSTAWRLELAALPLGGAAWLAYALVASSPFWQVLGVCYAAGCTITMISAVLSLRRPASRVVIVHE